MSFNEYQRGVMRTASDVTKATKENMLMNGILGTAGEAGELVDLLKKQIFQGHPFDKEHLIKECGDVLYYLALTAEALGLLCFCWFLQLIHVVPLVSLLLSIRT